MQFVRGRTWAVPLAIIAFAATARGDDKKVTTANDLVYTKIGNQELKLDLARPADGDGPFPAVVVIHGGAWRAGNKTDTRLFVEAFAARGYVAITPQYRFCPKD